MAQKSFPCINNNFSYTQLGAAFAPQKGSYYVHDDTDTFVLFFLSKILISLEDLFLLFVFFFFRKILISFMRFFLESFLAFLIIVCFSFYIGKNYEKYLISSLYEYFMNCFERLRKYFFIQILYLTFFIKNFFMRIFLIRIFFIRTFCSRISRNFYIFSNILRHLSYLRIYLFSSKNT